jgi:hypothetical protein
MNKIFLFTVLMIGSDMQSQVKVFVQNYGWVHQSLGLFGNLTFVAGSILFLPQMESYKTLGVWLFIVGSSSMLIGALGRFLVDVWEKS